MPSQPERSIVSQMEEWLGALEPAPSGACRETVLFEAGRAVGRGEVSRRRETRMWQAVTLAAVLTACISLGLHWYRESPKLVDAGKRAASQPRSHHGQAPRDGSPVAESRGGTAARPVPSGGAAKWTDLAAEPDDEPEPADLLEAALDTDDIVPVLEADTDEFYDFGAETTPVIPGPRPLAWRLLFSTHGPN